MRDKENQWNKTTHMLARYAEYANIGGNKTRVKDLADAGMAASVNAEFNCNIA